MILQCPCGAVTIHQDPDKLLVSATDTTAIVSFHRTLDGHDALKVQHLDCGSCQRAVVPIA